MTWPKEDMFAITVDGKVLMNAKAIDDVDLAKLVRKNGVFVGVPLSKKEARKLSEHVYDACSEVAAFISGGRRWRKPKRQGK